jgi:DNA-binding protein YbaB
MRWDADAMRREIDAAVDGYAAALATERVTVETDLVTAVARLDGVLVDVVIDPRALRKLGVDGLGEQLTDTLQQAERAAAQRRGELAGQVSFHGLPVFELVDEMINDPDAALRRLTGPGLGW